MKNVVGAENIVVLDEENPHIRNIRDGTRIKTDVNNGVCTKDMWICLDETGPVAGALWNSLQGRKHCAEVKQQKTENRKEMKKPN